MSQGYIIVKGSSKRAKMIDIVFVVMVMEKKNRNIVDIFPCLRLVPVFTVTKQVLKTFLRSTFFLFIFIQKEKESFILLK
jgi:hypothetical protein